MGSRKKLDAKIPNITTPWDNGVDAYIGSRVEEFIKEKLQDLDDRTREKFANYEVTDSEDNRSYVITFLNENGNLIGELLYIVKGDISAEIDKLSLLIIGGTSQTWKYGALEARILFKVDNEHDGGYDSVWSIDYSVIKNYSGGNRQEEFAVTLSSPGGGSAEDIHTSPNLQPYLSKAAGTIDRIIMVLKRADGNRTTTRTIAMQCVNAILTSSYNIGRVWNTGNSMTIPFTPVFSGLDAKIRIKVYGVDGTSYVSLDPIVGLTSNGQVQATIPSLVGGVHKIEAVLTLNDDTVESEPIELETIWIDDTNKNGIEIALYPVKNAILYDYTEIKYAVYNAGLLLANVIRRVLDGNEVLEQFEVTDPTGGTLTWNYLVPSTTNTISITCGIKTRRITFEATPSGVSWEAASNPELVLSALNRTNKDTNKEEWTNNGYTTTFLNMDFSEQSNTGWRELKLLKLNGSERATVNIYPFYDLTPYTNGRNGGGILATGRTVKIRFATHNVSDNSIPVIKCIDSANSGFMVTGDTIYVNIGKQLTSPQSMNQTDKKNDRHFASDVPTELTITVLPYYDENLLQTNHEVRYYVNGEIAGVGTFVATSLSQLTLCPIIFGGLGATIDIYNLRVYNRCLTSFEVLKTYTMDLDNSDDISNLFYKNQCYIMSGENEVSIDFQQAFEYAKSQSLKTSGEIALFATSDIRTGVDVTGIAATGRNRIELYFFVNGEVDAARSIAYEGYHLRIRVQGTSTAKEFRKNTRYDVKLFDKTQTAEIDDAGKAYVYKYTWDNVAQQWVEAGTAKKLNIVLTSTEDIPCTLLTVKTNFNESTGIRNVPMAKWTDEAIKAIAVAHPELYGDILTAPQTENIKVRQTVNGIPAIQFLIDSNGGYIFAGKVDLITDKSNLSVFGFGDDEDHSIEFRNNDSAVCNFRSPDLTLACVKLATDTGEQANGLKHLEYRYPDLDSQYGDAYVGAGTPLLNLFDFVYNCIPDDPNVLGTLSENGVISNTDGTITIEGQTYSDTPEARKLKFRTEFKYYAKPSSFIFNGLITEVLMWVDQRAKNQFFTHFKGEEIIDWQNQVRQRMGLLPYDIDTSLREDNDGNFRYDFTRLYSDEGIYDDGYTEGTKTYKSALFVLLDDVFEKEYSDMFNILASNGFFKYDTLKRYIIDNHASAFNAVIYNSDAEFKYLTKESDMAKVHGAGIEDIEWWLSGRLYFMGGKYYNSAYRVTDYAQSLTSFNLASDVSVKNQYIALYGNITDEHFETIRLGRNNLSVKSYNRNFINCEVGTTLVAKGMCEEDDSWLNLDLQISGVGNETRLGLYGGRFIKDFAIHDNAEAGLSMLQVSAVTDWGECTNIQALRFGSKNTPQYCNGALKNLNIGTNTFGSCKILDLSNCYGLDLSQDIKAFPILEELYMGGCSSVTNVSLPTGDGLKSLILSDSITSLELENKPNLTLLDFRKYDTETGQYKQSFPKGLLTLSVSNCNDYILRIVVELILENIL